MRNTNAPDVTNGRLSIRLLGELEVRRNGVKVPLPASRRTRALLGYLAMSSGAVVRSTLCDLLWDGPDDPRAALRWSLSKLRPLVGDAAVERIVADRTHVAFDAAGAFVDSSRVLTLLAQGPIELPVAALEEAAQLLRGEFLGGLELPGCYRFHNWCVGQRERFVQMRKAVLRALIDRLAHAGPLAMRYGRELVEADPLDESAHATLIGLLDAAGRRPDADNHLRYTRELLEREVGARACTMFDDAVRRMRHAASLGSANNQVDRALDESKPPSIGAIFAPTQTARSPSLEQLGISSSPLVGRVQECAKLDDLLATSRAHGLTLLTGEPGIGKTRLLDYFSQCAASASFRVLRGRCYEVEAIRPYGIWMDALGDVGTGAFAAADLQFPPVTVPLPPGTLRFQPDEQGREHFFQAVFSLLGRLCVDHRLVVVLDDLQWLDESSAALLHFVLRRMDGALPVLFVAAARPAETEDNRCARILLQSLARDGRLTRLPLTPLAGAEVGALIEACGSALCADRALTDSGGNPLYVIELARARPSDRDACTCSVDTLIAERLAPLDPPTRNLLSFAALTGRAFGAEQLARLLDRPLADVLSCVTELQRRGIFVAATDTEFDFAHDLVRQTVCRMLAQPQRRAIHHQIARHLLAASAHDPHLHGEVVYHATLGGDALMTARACVEASHHCARIFASTEARSLAERGLAHARSLPRGTERVHLEIQLLTARLVAIASSGQACAASMEQEFEHAIQQAEALSLHADVVQGFHSLSWLTQQANDIERTREVTIRAETAARKADAATCCRQLANTGRCLLELERDLPRARDVLQEAGVLATRLDLRVVELMWGEALLARADGDLTKGCARLEEAVRQARAIEDHWREYQCLVWLATMTFERRAYQHVTRLTGEIIEAAHKMGDCQVAYVEVISAIAALRLGNRDARPFPCEQLDALRQNDDKRHLCYALNELVRACLDQLCSVDITGLGHEALGAAEALNSPNETIVATALLLEATHCAGTTEDADRSLHSLRALLADTPLAPRSHAAVQRLCAHCPGIATLVQTQLN
ncbi:ATP-binding protein [Caballeronia grimmiae]|uniref:ATP-binding protein n=1 Tax=Caballeronia grimmiae TaxID=1071679 RepID=UPI0038BB786B